jgi:hypothetical protein
MNYNGPDYLSQKLSDEGARTHLYDEFSLEIVNTWVYRYSTSPETMHHALTVETQIVFFSTTSMCSGGKQPRSSSFSFHADELHCYTSLLCNSWPLTIATITNSQRAFPLKYENKAKK